MIIRGWNDVIDSSNTPPAPPMAVVHQRCVIVLHKLDESNSKIQIEPNVIQNLFSDLFLSESSAIMFQKDSNLTVCMTSPFPRVELNLISVSLFTVGGNVLPFPWLHSCL